MFGYYLISWGVDMLLCLENISYSVTDGKGRSTHILEDISFSVSQSERFVVLGPSGAGKSTLLRLLNRLQDPTQGRILLDGEDICKLNVIALRRRCAMVLQQPVPLPGSVEENLLTGPRLLGEDIEQARKQVPQLVKLVRLEPGMRNRPAAELSVGQQHRVALARALMNNPDILLLDEPTAALDPGTASAILDLVVRLNEEVGITVITVTHSFRDARRFATAGAVIIDGRLHASGPLDALDSSSDPAVAAFLRGE